MEDDDKPRTATRILHLLYALEWGGDRHRLDTIVEAIEEFGSACYSQGYSEGYKVTPGMIEAGVAEIWPDPKPPAFIGNLAERVYRAMDAVRRSECQTSVPARRQ